MNKVLIILSPPRSFSSVVSTMIGQHPELYGFPELHLFSADTVAETIKIKSNRGKITSPGFLSGLLRTIAQEHYGYQSTETILNAMDWLIERKDWSTAKLFHYLTDLVSPKMAVEKTPNTAKKKKSLERAYDICQDAYFLHLTRHPLPTRKSIADMVSSRKKETSLDGFFIWYSMHKNIINFTQSLPLGQTMRIKGEHLLSEPDVYLPQIASWLGVSSSTEAIEAMKHPEDSPYAYTGPPPCLRGNDPKFLRNPTLRPGKIKEPDLSKFFTNEQWQWESPVTKLSESDPDLSHHTKEDLAEELLNLASLLGYQ